MPYELISKGGTFGALFILIAFLINWLVKSLQGVIDKNMEQSKSREDFLLKEMDSMRTIHRQEIESMRLEQRQERNEFINTIDKYNHSLERYNQNLERMTDSMNQVQQDITYLKMIREGQ